MDTPPTAKRLKSHDPRRRPKPGQVHYGSLHQKLRALRIGMFPVCEDCGNQWSCHGHHIVYPAKTVDDYRALCVPCHRRRHRREDQSQAH